MQSDDVSPHSTVGCDNCGHLACVCDVVAHHEENCPFRVSATCRIPVECDHGRDVCPVCDPCTCGPTGREHRKLYR